MGTLHVTSDKPRLGIHVEIHIASTKAIGLRVAAILASGPGGRTVAGVTMPNSENVPSGRNKDARSDVASCALELAVEARQPVVGDAYDNAMCENFFATLECKLLG